MDILLCLVDFLLWADLRELQKQKVHQPSFSVEGMNFDFVAMNLTGFLFYSIYNTYGYFVNTDQTGQVDLNDVVFAYHALFATLICVSQTCFFPHGSNIIHRPTFILLILMWGFVGVYSILTFVR